MEANKTCSSGYEHIHCLRLCSLGIQAVWKPLLPHERPPAARKDREPHVIQLIIARVLTLCLFSASAFCVIIPGGLTDSQRDEAYAIIDTLDDD